MADASTSVSSVPPRQPPGAGLLCLADASSREIANSSSCGHARRKGGVFLIGEKLAIRSRPGTIDRREIDLIGGEKDVLCFIEAKNRTSRDVKTAEAAVGGHKPLEIAQLGRDSRRRLPSCQWKFDVISVYYDGSNSRPQFEVFRNAPLAA